VNWTSSGGSFTGSVFTAPSATGQRDCHCDVAGGYIEIRNRYGDGWSCAACLRFLRRPVSILAQGTQRAFTASGNWTVLIGTVTALLARILERFDQSGNYTAPRTPPPGGDGHGFWRSQRLARALRRLRSSSRRRRCPVNILFPTQAEDAGGFLLCLGNLHGERIRAYYRRR